MCEEEVALSLIPPKLVWGWVVRSRKTQFELCVLHNVVGRWLWCRNISIVLRLGQESLASATLDLLVNDNIVEEEETQQQQLNL